MVKIALIIFAGLFFASVLMDFYLGAAVSILFVGICLYLFLKSNNNSSKRSSVNLQNSVPVKNECSASEVNQDSSYSISKPENTAVPKSNPQAHNPYIFNADYINECRNRFIAFDVETTGLDPLLDRIIEISAIVFENFVPVRSFSTLINPERKIPSAASSINGIYDSDVRDAPLENIAISKFCEFIGDSALSGDCVLVAHNAVFDIKFLLYALSRNGVDADICFQDTLYMARQWGPDTPDCKLGTLAQHYGILQESAHRAEDDARVCGEIFVKLIEQHYSDLSRQFDQLCPAEKDLCMWFKKILVDADCNTDLLTFSSSSYFSVNCLYTVFKAKPKAKKPYILIPSNFDIPDSLSVSATTKSEGDQFVRLFYETPDQLDAIKNQIIEKYQEVFSSASSFVAQSDRNMRAAAQKIFNHISV